MKIHFVAMAMMLAACSYNVSQQANSQATNSDLETSISADTTVGRIVADSVSLTWIKDMPGNLKHGKDIFPNIPDSIFRQVGCQDGIPSSMSCFLLEADGQKVLFDAGLGLDNCLLLKSLKELNIKPEDLTLIYLTHLHNDHIGTLVRNDTMVFPNAKLYLNKVEYDAWRAMESGNQNQLKMLDVYKDNLVLFNAGDTLPVGVVSIEAYGHTPGHTAYQKGRFLIVGDIIHGRAIQLAHPEYSPIWDMDADKAVETRKRLIQYAQDNSLIMAGMHFPAAGFMIFEKL